MIKMKMKKADSIIDLIGNTPLIELRKIKPKNDVKIFAKLEYFNPTGSHKDRIAFYMIRDAIKNHNLKQGDMIVEASSGNTAISVAFVSNFYGLKPVIVIPKNTSKNKVAILKLLGAEIIEGSDNPNSENYYIKLAEKIAKERNAVFLNQYTNKSNMLAHYETTANEIWKQLNGKIDVFVMGVGTGGSITGIGKFLKEKRSDIIVVAVTPKNSPLANGSIGEKIEGLLHSDIPKLFKENRDVVDRIIEVSYREAVEMCIKLIKEEGILAGISSGANIAGALKISKELDSGNIVTIAADSIFRYLTDTDLVHFRLPK